MPGLFYFYSISLLVFDNSFGCYLVHLEIELLFAAWALEEFAAVAGPFGREPVVVTARTVLDHRFVVREEVALRIVRTAPESALELAATTLDQIAGVTLRTLDTARDRTRVFAIRISAASDELTEARRALDQITFLTLRTDLADLLRFRLADGLQ
jgi:hypothetical protein